MARRVTSQLVVELLDRVSEPARRMREALGGITQSVRDANAQRVDFGQRIDAAITRNNRAIEQTRGRMIDAAAGAYMLARGLSSPVRVAADFEQGMNRVRVLTGATEEQFEAMSAQARELGRTTMFSATDATEGMGFLAQAGFETDQIVGALPSTLQLAAAGQMDLASAADLASNVLDGYRLEVEDLAHVNDVMAATFTSTNTNLAQLGEAMSYAAPFAASAGVEFEEASAAIGLMGSAGIQGSRAGTALGQAINRMLNPTAQMRDDMEELGLSFTDSEGRLLPLVDVVRQLEERSEDAGLMARLFGQRAGPAMASLAGMGADELEQLRDRMDDVGGTAQRIADVEMEGFNGRVRAMRSAMEGLQLVIGNALLPALTSIVEVLTDIAQPLAGLIEQYPQVTAAIIGLSTSVVAFRIAAIGARFVGLHLKGALLALAAPAWRAAAGVGALATAVVATSWGALTAGLARARWGMIAFAAAARIGGVSTALWAVGTSALAALSPLRLLRAGLRRTAVSMRVLTAAVVGTGVGAVLVGIGLAGAWIYRNWSGIREAFEGFREGFKAAIEPVRPALEPLIGLFETLFGWIGRLTGPLDASAEDWREWGRGVGETIGTFVATVMELPERIRGGIRASIAWFGALGERAGTALGELWAGFETTWDGIVDYVHGKGAAMRDAGRDATVALWVGMRTRLGAVHAWAGGVIDDISGRIEEDGLLATGAELVDSMLRGMIGMGADLLEWTALLPARIIDSIAGTSLAEPGRDMIRSLRRGIAERFSALRDWATSWPGEIAEQIRTDGLLSTGADLLGSMRGGMVTAASDLFEWTATIPLRIIDRIAGTSLADTGRDMIRGLRAGIAERFDSLVAWSMRWPHEIAAQVAEDGLLETGRELLQSLWDGMLALREDLLYWAAGIPGEIADLIAETDLLGVGRDIIQSLWDGMMQRFNEFIGWIRGIPGEIRDAIGDIDLSGIIQWPQRPEWLGGQSGSVMDGHDGAEPDPNRRSPREILRERTGAIDLGIGSVTDRLDGARRRGGPISVGGSYLVGEEEPEIVTPTRSGYVHPLSALARRLAGASGAPATGPSDALRIADGAMQLIGARLGAALRGLGADNDFVGGEARVHLAPLILDVPEVGVSADVRVERADADAPALHANVRSDDAAPNMQTQSPSSDRTIKQDFHVTITPTIQVDRDAGRDPRATGDEVARQMDRAVREAFRGVMADTGMRTV